MTSRTRLLESRRRVMEDDDDDEEEASSEIEEEEEEEEEEEDEDFSAEEEEDVGFRPGARVEASAAAFGANWARAHRGERYMGVLKKKKKDGVWYVVYEEDDSVFATAEKHLRLVEKKRKFRSRQQVSYVDIEEHEFDSMMEYSDNEKRKVSKSSVDEFSSSDQESREEDDENSGDEEKKDDLAIERLLCRCSVSAEAWKVNMCMMNTAEVIQGSMYIQEEDPSAGERFLVKWKGLSYLHVSWETRKDLESEVGQIETKRAITSLQRRIENGEDLELDCPSAKADLLEASFFDVERILDVFLAGDGLSVSDLSSELGITTQSNKYKKKKKAPPTNKHTDTIDCVQAILTKMGNDSLNNAEPIESLAADTLAETVSQLFQADTSAEGDSPVKVLVKWRGLGYAEASIETYADVLEHSLEGKDVEWALIKCLRRYLIGNSPKKAKEHRVTKPEAIRPYLPLKAYSDPLAFSLRDYQVEGTLWLIHNYLQKTSCVLADEMGLGKTVQTVSLVRMVKVFYKSKHPALIVAPLSTLEHWQREFCAWTNLDVCLYHGGIDDRQAARDLDIFGGTHSKKIASVDVIVTTYEQLMLEDARELARLTYSVIVIDEAHRLKNPNSRLYKTLTGEFASNSRHPHFESRMKLLLTGTPLQNDVKELWSILSFCDPDAFDDCDEFVQEYSGCATTTTGSSSTDDDQKDSANLISLLEKMRPYVLRREKAHVEKSVPPKSEIVVEVALAPTQKRCYRALYEKNVSMLALDGAKDGPALTNLAMELRKCCNHPFLLKGVEDSHQFFDRATRRTSYDSVEHATKDDVDILVDTCGKLQFLDKLLPDRKEKHSKVLIFSQFTMMLNVLEDYLQGRSYSYGRIDGGVTGRDRQRQIDDFCRPDSKVFVMLLSTRAGGVGINLVAADTVVIYDSDWNPQNDVQAMARCHRIGQTKPVSVYRLLTSGTYETHMYDVATAKLDLDRAVLDGMAGKKSLNKGSRQLQENLLRRGVTALAAPKDEEEQGQDFNAFKNQDLDSILKTRSRQVVLSRNEGGGALESLSTATFVINRNADQEDVDLDDPDFWRKTLGRALEDHEKMLATKASSGDKSRTAKSKVSYKEERYDSFFLSQDRKRGRVDSDDEHSPKRHSGDESDEDDENTAPGTKKKTKKLFDHTNNWRKGHLHALKQQVTKRGIGKNGTDFIHGSKDLMTRAELTSPEEVKEAARTVLLSHARALAYLEFKKQARTIQTIIHGSIDEDSILVDAAKRIIFRYKAVRKAAEEATQLDSSITMAAALADKRGDDETASSPRQKKKPPLPDFQNDDTLGKYIINLKVSAKSNLSEICFALPPTLDSMTDLSEDDVKQSRLFLEKCHYQEVIRLVVERLNAVDKACTRRGSSPGGASPRHAKKLNHETKLEGALGENEPPANDKPDNWWRARHDCALLKYADYNGSIISEKARIDILFELASALPDHVANQVLALKEYRDNDSPESTLTAAEKKASEPASNFIPSKEVLKARLNALVITVVGPLPREHGRGLHKEAKKRKARSLPLQEQVSVAVAFKQTPAVVDLTASSPEKNGTNLEASLSKDNDDPSASLKRKAPSPKKFTSSTTVLKKQTQIDTFFQQRARPPP